MFLSNYADDNNLCNTGNNLANMDLQTDFWAITNWFFENYMTLNSERYHYMCIGKTVQMIHLYTRREETILGVITDNKLTFHSHVKGLCKKTGQKLPALSRISTFIDLNQRQILFQSMIKLQFSYCPLIWMFCSSKSNNLINKIHERSLRIVTNDKNSNFEKICASKEFRSLNDSSF